MLSWNSAIMCFPLIVGSLAFHGNHGDLVQQTKFEHVGDFNQNQ